MLTNFFEGEMQVGIGGHWCFFGNIGNAGRTPYGKGGAMIGENGGLCSNKGVCLLGDYFCSKQFGSARD